MSSENAESSESTAIGGRSYVELQRKYIEVFETVKYYQEQAKQYKTENRSLKLKINEFEKGGMPYPLLMKSLDPYVSDGLKCLFDLQLKSKNKFSDDERKFVVGLYKCSPQAYEFLQKEGINLPLEKDVLKLQQRQEAAELDDNPSAVKTETK